ncbi:MAG: GNAT family N-acetyltransferase [SAR202 cluster bacterium]|nr:GNAT family N-acetyltransferase [SAR202 cluster bacterium]MDP6512360.1 GNAT family N-acetyltransferase [SAR202 cluster bacterium]MDP6714072.1 GNAT family N-acetyltransferase [SAR202 cluster bacterium]
MQTPTSLTFKMVSEDWEYEQIHRLNYQTFVQEIPQHEPNSEERRVDPFHANNTYFLCLEVDTLIGMVSVNDTRPFSLDLKFQALDMTLDSALDFNKSICEIRLLAVKKDHRHGRVVQGLLTMLVNHCIKREYDLGIVSGTLTQEKFYDRLGFQPFGPVVGAVGAQFQPMSIDIKECRERLGSMLHPELNKS